MDGKEAIKALMDGKRVTRPGWLRPIPLALVGDQIVNSDGVTWSMADVLAVDGWAEFNEPLTDEQLCSEWARLSLDDGISNASKCMLLRCARQLKERKL